MTELLDTLDRLKQRRVLVLGDLILDRYTWGAAERVSPEAPTIVLRVDQVDVRLGGAAAVASLLRGLGADVAVAGVVGDDLAGRTMRQLLVEMDVDSGLLLTDDSRPTTVKDRYLGRAPHRTSQQILRVDHETIRNLSADIAGHLVDGVTKAVVDSDSVVVSDYAKGVCCPNVLTPTITAARHAGIPVIVDPGRGIDWTRYRGATVIKPNRIEAEIAAALPITNVADSIQAARELARAYGSAVVITLDHDGITLATTSDTIQNFPTSEIQVADITGAGDTVAAIMGLALANEVPLPLALPLANLAASRQIRRSGINPVTLDELRADAVLQTHPPKTVEPGRLSRMVAQYRRDGQRIVLTNGCFDLLHVGHVTYLEKAARLGDVLIVAINSDDSVRAIKGAPRPLIGERDRARMLAALACVDHVVIFSEPTPHEVLRTVRPDVLVKGGDYSASQVVGREFVESYGGRVEIVDSVPGVSTSQLLDRLPALRKAIPRT